MLVLLIIYILSQDVTANQTQVDMEEAFKFFQKMHALQSMETTWQPEKELREINPLLARPPPERDILSVIHELKPFPLATPSASPHEEKEKQTPPLLLESREVDSLSRETERAVTASVDDSEEDNKRLLALLRKLFGPKNAQQKMATDLEGNKKINWIRKLLGMNDTNVMDSNTKNMNLNKPYITVNPNTEIPVQSPITDKPVTEYPTSEGTTCSTTTEIITVNGKPILRVEENRKMINWFKKLFGQTNIYPTTTSRATTTTTTEKTSFTVINDEGTSVKLDSKVDELILNLKDVLEKISKNLLKEDLHETKSVIFLIVREPCNASESKGDNKVLRVKRDALNFNNDTTSGKTNVNDNKDENASNLSYLDKDTTDLYTTAKIENNERLSVASTDKTPANNSQDKTENGTKRTYVRSTEITSAENGGEVVEADNSSNIKKYDNTSPLPDVPLKSGRRIYYDPIEKDADSIKDKLLQHVEKSFIEVKEKLAPLIPIKNFYENESMYKIGFLTASLDTLDNNLVKMKKDLDDNVIIYDEKKVLDVFEMISTANGVVDKLMESLKSLTQSGMPVKEGDVEQVQQPKIFDREVD